MDWCTGCHDITEILLKTINQSYAFFVGSLESNEQCATCSLGRLYCPGHMGHIELPVPVYHPLFFDTVYMVRFIVKLK